MGYQPSSPLHAWTLEGDAVLWQKVNENVPWFNFVRKSGTRFVYVQNF
jgi:hypothetical protein